MAGSASHDGDIAAGNVAEGKLALPPIRKGERIRNRCRGVRSSYGALPVLRNWSGGFPVSIEITRPVSVPFCAPFQNDFNIIFSSFRYGICSREAIVCPDHGHVLPFGNADKMEAPVGVGVGIGWTGSVHADDLEGGAFDGMALFVDDTSADGEVVTRDTRFLRRLTIRRHLLPLWHQ